MSDAPQGPGWWQASDGKWYAPELHPDAQAAAPPPAAAPTAEQPATPPPAPTAQQPASPPPAAPPPASPPPGAAPPASPPPGATPGAPPPYGAAPGAPPPFTPAAASSPPPGGDGSGGGKGKVVLVVVLLLVVAAIGAGLAFALTSGGDDDGDTASESTTTTDAEDRDPPVSRTLLPRTTTSLDDDPTTTLGIDELDLGLGGLEDEIDPEVALCIGTEVMADPELTAALEGNPDPSDPAFERLFTVLVDCGGRPFLEEAVVAELPPDQAACATEVFATLDDATLTEMFLVFSRIGLSQTDPTPEELAIIDPLLPCIV